MPDSGRQNQAWTRPKMFDFGVSVDIFYKETLGYEKALNTVKYGFPAEFCFVNNSRHLEAWHCQLFKAKRALTPCKSILVSALLAPKRTSNLYQGIHVHSNNISISWIFFSCQTHNFSSPYWIRRCNHLIITRL